ncbi:zinc finger and SCAN domain-containing protein 23 [Trichonephila inaurata madagascariensis]|uniref:Zinc finger and SCAN domain-containing protein 23 n=1 Tax=Trichonephila inaurata madagascariensis TaxID=2747483 RepID=A0A8X7CCC7_9ARAC|nr:zinc finger and SCAN domain-containing protein 23 [Trichonephila inaurata madagascariensis]
MEAYLSNDRNVVFQNEFLQNIENEDLFPLFPTNAFENFQTEFQPTENVALFAPSSALQYKPQIEGNVMESQMYKVSGHETSSQWQNHIQADQPNSFFECNYSNGVNSELRQEREQETPFDISFDSRRIATASETILGQDSLNNDLLSQIIDTLLLEIPPSDFNFLDSQEEICVLNDELLATNLGSTIESNSEYVDLSNNRFKNDLSVESLKSSHSSKNSNTFIEDHNFETQAKPDIETAYHCDTCLNKFHSNDTLFKHKCIYSSEKPFQNEIYERNFSQMEHLSKYTHAHTMEKFFQCIVCNQKFLTTDFEQHMLEHSTSQIQKATSKHKISLKEHTPQMCTHTPEKPYQCVKGALSNSYTSVTPPVKSSIASHAVLLSKLVEAHGVYTKVVPQVN